jgi:hypothetical protein
MSTVQRKVQTVLWYAKFEFIIRVQREFRSDYGLRPSENKSIRRWYGQFRESDSMEKRHSTGRYGRSYENVDRLRHPFEEVDLPSKCRVAGAAIDCPQNSSEEPTSKYTQITGNPETYST